MHLPPPNTRWLRSWPFLVLLAMAGCASTHAIKVQHIYPEQLFLDCPTPSVEARTNGELARTLMDFRSALQTCNDDKAALREWAKGN